MRRCLRCVIAAVVLAVPLVSVIAGQDGGPEPGKPGDDPELSAILDRAAARVRQYALGLQHLAWTSVVRYEVLDKDGHPIKTGEPGEVTYETISRLVSVSVPGGDSVVVPRGESELKFVDGKPVKSNYKLPWHYAAPNDGFPLLLLPEFRGSYSFSYAGHGDLRGEDALMVEVDFVWPREEGVPRVLWGRDQYVLGVAGLKHRGKVWIDPETFDVLQLDYRAGPVEPVKGGNKQDRLRYERRWTHRFKSMTFENPEQLYLVPEFWEVETLLDGESPALRRERHTFKDFRRFLGEVQVTPVDDQLNAK
jgi:hypothetical protein